MAFSDPRTIAIAIFLIVVFISILPFAKRLELQYIRLRLREASRQLPINTSPQEDLPKYSPHREPPPAYIREPVIYPPEFANQVILCPHLPMPVTAPTLNAR